MKTFVRKGVTYAMAYRPACGLWPNRDEGVILRKTDERVRVFELAGWKSSERVVWKDAGDFPGDGDDVLPGCRVAVVVGHPHAVD